MERMSREEKQRAIKKEIARIKKITGKLSEDKKRIADGLIQEAAFMRVTLGELREIIDEDGPLNRFVQGEYEYDREHPAVKSYNTMIQRYASVSKLLFDLLPDADKNQNNTDELMNFVKGRAKK